MRAIDVVRMALQMTDEGIRRLVADMRDTPLIPSTPGGKGGDGNHPLWIMGHLAFIEGTFRTIVRGEPNPVGHWASLFAPGTRPTADADRYPPFDEVLGAYRELRSGTLRLLEELGDAGLDQTPRWVPPGFEDAMRTVGQSLLLLSLHQMVHYGQITDARRVAGREPLL